MGDGKIFILPAQPYEAVIDSGRGGQSHESCHVGNSSAFAWHRLQLFFRVVVCTAACAALNRSPPIDEARARIGRHSQAHEQASGALHRRAEQPGRRSTAGGFRQSRAAVGRLLRRRSGEDGRLAAARVSRRRSSPVRSAGSVAARPRRICQRHLDRLANCGCTISPPTTTAATCCCTRARTCSWPSFLGGCGPGWYMEGTAELFGTHRIDPQDRRADAAASCRAAATKCRCWAASS